MNSIMCGAVFALYAVSILTLYPNSKTSCKHNLYRSVERGCFFSYMAALVIQFVLVGGVVPNKALAHLLFAIIEVSVFLEVRCCTVTAKLRQTNVGLRTCYYMVFFELDGANTIGRFQLFFFFFNVFP
jgi:hypothetical protein